MSITEALISVELADAVRKISHALGNDSPVAFICPSCRQPLRPHISAENKVAAHFEHLEGSEPCAGAA